MATEQLNESTPEINQAGDKIWRNTVGELHRAGGPAIEGANGTKEWYRKGKLHRVGGPAIEYAGGDTAWYQHGYLHRVSGPAIETANGRNAWYENGEEYNPGLSSSALLAEHLGRLGIAADASPGAVKIVLDSPITIEVTSLTSVRELFQEHGEHLMKAAGARAGEIVFLAAKAEGQVPGYVKDRGLQKVARDALTGNTTLKDVAAGALTRKTPHKQATRDQGR